MTHTNFFPIYIIIVIIISGRNYVVQYNFVTYTFIIFKFKGNITLEVIKAIFSLFYMSAYQLQIQTLFFRLFNDNG